jgi:hypothetical protein
MSSARTIFLMVSGYQAPPLIDGSSAWIITSRPATMPMPVMQLAPGASPRLLVMPASVDSSRNGVAGSSSLSSRWRADCLPSRARRARSRGGRSWRAARWRSWSSAASARLCA